MRISSSTPSVPTAAEVAAEVWNAGSRQLTAEIVPAVTASDNILLRRDTETTLNNDTWATIVAWVLKAAGTVRLKLDLKSTKDEYTVSAVVKINGATVGTVMSHNTTTYLTVSQDYNVQYGDLFEVLVWDGASNAVTVRNIRLHGVLSAAYGFALGQGQRIT